VATVVLVHGFPGFTRIGPIEYFHGVQAHLEGMFPGLRVMEAALSPVGTVPERAGQLAGLLPTGEKVHIIAHSGGGLDARYLVSKPHGLGRTDLVASITTIGTPHGGTPLADAAHGVLRLTPEHVEALLSRVSVVSVTTILGLAGSLLRLLDFIGIGRGFVVREVLGRLQAIVADAEPFLRDVLGVRPEAIEQFTTESMKKFNADISDAAGVVYRSYAGEAGLTKGESFLTPFTAVAHLLVLATAGPNDGWIPVASAKGPGFVKTIHADHGEQIGHPEVFLRSGTEPRFAHLEFYQALVEEALG
jgi:triacylglycerol lipase